MTKGINTFSLNFGASMKALRFLTILLTTFSLYTVQTMVTQPAFAQSSNSSTSKDSGGFFSGGAGANVTLSGKEKKGDEKKGLNMNMILLLVAVLAAPMYVLFCGKRIDSWVYAATAAVYVGMEIANWQSYKAQSDREMKAKNTANKDVNEEQKKSLMEAASQTGAAVTAAEKRAQAATIATAGFLAAGAVALTMAILDSPSPACTASIASGSVTPDAPPCSNYACPAVVAAGESIQQIYLGADEVFIKIASNNYGNMEQYILSAENDKDFLIRNGELDRMSKGAISSMTVEASNLIGDTFPELEKETQFVSAFKFIGYNIADLFLPKAEAGDGKLMALGLGVGGAAMFGLMKLPFLAGLKTFLGQGFTRAASHIVMAGMAGLVAKDSKEAANQLKGRAAQYKELAAKLGMSSISTANHNADTIINVDPGATGLTAIDKDNLSGRTCFTGSKGQLNEDKNCACKSAKNCKRTEIPKLSSMSTVSIPNAIKTSTSSLGAAGNSLFSGDLEGALSESNAAGKNAARLRKLNVGLKKRANQFFASNGAKGINFDKLESGFRNRLLKAAVADIKNLSADGKSALAGRFPGVFGDGADVEKDPNEGIKIGDTGAKTGSVSVAKAATSTKKKDPMAGFAFDIEDSEDVKDQVAVNSVGALGGGEDQVELDKEDIAGDRNKNIFSLITKRYFKTAYPRFFEARE